MILTVVFIIDIDRKVETVLTGDETWKAWQNIDDVPVTLGRPAADGIVTGGNAVKSGDWTVKPAWRKLRWRWRYACERASWWKLKSKLWSGQPGLVTGKLWRNWWWWWWFWPCLMAVMRWNIDMKPTIMNILCMTCLWYNDGVKWRNLTWPW